MKKLILLQATNDGSYRTIRSTYGKLGGGNAVPNDGRASPFILEINYEKIETTRKLRSIEKEESE